MTRVLRAVAAAAVVLAVTGCGGGGDDVAEPAAGASPAFEVARSWTWRESDGRNRDAETTFEVGEFALLPDAPRLPGFASVDELVEACLLDGDADALAPVAVGMTNRAAGPASLATAVSRNSHVQYVTATPTEVLLVTPADGDDGRVGCDPLLSATRDDGSWYPGWGDVPAGAATDRAYAYLLVRDFFSEEEPPRSPEIRLERVSLEVGDLDPETRFTSIDGPALDAPLRFDDPRIVGAGFPIDGKRRPCGFGDQVVRCRS